MEATSSSLTLSLESEEADLSFVDFPLMISSRVWKTRTRLSSWARFKAA